MSKLIARLSALVEEARGLSVELNELAELDELSEEQEVRFAELAADEGPIEALVAEKADIEKRLAILEAASNVANTEIGEDRSVPHFMKQTSREVDLRTASRGEVRSAAMAILEREAKDQVVPVSDETATQVARLIAQRTMNTDGDVIARRLILTESDAYRSAFGKALTSAQPAWTSEEAQAVQMFRAAEQSLTSASGGYGVPVLIDPTIIVTSGAASAPLLGASRVISITTNVWKGVSSAGVAFAEEAESDPIAAQQATLVQPSITTEKAAAFIPFSFEIEGDYPNFAGEMQALIEQAWIDYLAVNTATGAAGIVGIFTAIDAVSASEVTPTTDGGLAPVDAVKLFNALPERYRQRAAWFSHVTVESKFRQSGTDNGLFTVDASVEGISRLLGKPYMLSDYAPSFSGTTGASNLAILGDFSRYVIAQRVGMNVEFIPHVFDGNGVPKGQRGWLAWARAGADAVDTNAFRLLQNQ
jgi:HK97 family phage major capsid protein